MAEYIEREVALKLLNRNSITKHITFADDVSIYDTIKNIPAADVVEVVRCGQCKHATEDIIVEGVCYCHKIQQGMFVDGFCSYGERRKE